MDEKLRAQLDALTEQELVQGFRNLEVPYVVQRALDSARQLDPAIPKIERIRLTKLNPKKKALVSDAVLAKYHADIQNKNILSNNALRKLNIERGVWSDEKDKQIEELQLKTTKLMELLSMEGLDKERNWRGQLQKGTEKYISELEASDKHPDEKEYLKNIFSRWSNYSKDLQPFYTETYAQSQGKEEYSASADLDKLYNTAPTPEASEALEELDDVAGKLEMYMDLHRARTELTALLVERAGLYAQSVESRKDATEEMARIYYGSTLLDASGSPLGPITPTFDAFWELPEELISWILEEAYFFYNNVANVIRKNMDEWGFTTAGRESGLVRLLEELPDPQNSKLATLPSPATVPDSSE